MDTPPENEETAESFLLVIVEYDDDIDEMSLPSAQLCGSAASNSDALPRLSIATLSAAPASFQDQYCPSAQKRERE